MKFWDCSFYLSWELCFCLMEDTWRIYIYSDMKSRPWAKLHFISSSVSWYWSILSRPGIKKICCCLLRGSWYEKISSFIIATKKCVVLLKNHEINMKNKTIGILLTVYSIFMLGVNILFNESNADIILIVLLMVCGFWLIRSSSKR